MSVAETTITAEDRAAFLEPVRRLLADRCTEGDVRRIMESETGHDPALWQALCEMGLPGLGTSPELGGTGLGAIEIGLVMEAAGAALCPAPLISTWAACRLLEAAGEHDLVRAIVAGERIAAVAFCDAWATGSNLRATDRRLSGTARFVPDAQIADVILIVRDQRVYLVERADARIAPLPTFDRTRRMADVSFENSICLRNPSHGWKGIQDAHHLAIVALAGEQAGAARRLLEMTVAYATERHQFGRAIGSFQAIKHMAADLLLEVESATSAARNAARQLAEDATGRDAAIALAAFACTDAFVKVATDAIQMHGGIAFTWDHPAHLYLRRARSGAQLYGDAAHWRERYIQALEAA